MALKVLPPMAAILAKKLTPIQRPAVLWAVFAVQTVAAVTDEAWAAFRIKTVRRTAVRLPRKSCVRARLVFQRIRCVVRMGAIVQRDHIV